MRPGTDEVARRTELILRALGIYTPERTETIKLLLDDHRPSAFGFLAAISIPFSAGATTRQLLDAIAASLGRSRIDREQRDYVFAPLREVGILRIGTADKQNAGIIPDQWKPKSPNSVYYLDPEFRRLLECPIDEFDAALQLWIGEKPIRLQRITSAEARAFASQTDQRLVPLTILLYCTPFLRGYQVVYVELRP